MSNIKNLFENILCIPLFIFSRFIPKDRNLWIFGAWFGYRYSDNPRYVFEYVNNKEPDIRTVWLSRDKRLIKHLTSLGYEAYYLRSLKAFWLSCRASAVFLSCGQTDINLVGSFHARKVQLWHGIPLKKIKADDKNSRFNRSGFLFHLLRFVWMKVFPFDSEKWDVLITSGPEMTSRMASAFNGFMARNGKCVELGNPRADKILAPPDPVVLKPFTKNFPVEKIICYAPTFRGNSSTLNLFDGLNLRLLDDLLNKWNALLLIKLHFYDRERMIGDNFPQRVHFVTDNELEDINLLLPHVDILITDYSSVFFDYLLLDRPILFSAFDLDSYISNERELYENYEEATPGKICLNWGNVINELELIFQGKDEFHEQRIYHQQRFFKYIDQDNSLRITNYIKEQLTLN